jgi:hypothetical protein
MSRKGGDRKCKYRAYLNNILIILLNLVLDSDKLPDDNQAYVEN